jgi:hypothetical protein
MRNTITVKELMDVLKELDQDKEIFTYHNGQLFNIRATHIDNCITDRYDINLIDPV